MYPDITQKNFHAPNHNISGLSGHFKMRNIPK